MRCSCLFYLCLSVALLVLTVSLPAHATRTTAECLHLGFDKDVVRCHYCEKLFMVTQNAELQEECNSCCTSTDEDAAQAKTKYASARIEGRSISRALDSSSMNALSLFYRANQKEPYFSRLTFKDKYAAVYPQIVLVNANGEDAVTLRIMGWSPETLHEFMTKKIQVD